MPVYAMAEETSPGVPSGTFVQAFLGLAVIVALLVATVYLGRKVWGGKGFGHGGLSIVGGVALSPRERIVLIEAGDTWLVVGIVPGQIRTLHSMPKGSLPEGTTVQAPFAQWLKQMTEQRSS